MTLEQIKEKFIPVYKHFEDFVPMSSKGESDRVKRKGLMIDQGSLKWVKTSKGVFEGVSEEELKGMIQLVPLEEIYIEALQIKEKFIPVYKHFEDFVPMSSKGESDRVKRKGLMIDQGSLKWVKTSKGVFEGVSEEELKGMMQLVPLEEIYIEALQKLHDEKIKNRIFNIGDQVLLFNSRLKIFSGKLKSRWSGPFTIAEIYPYGTAKLVHPDGCNFKVHCHRLKHYHGGDPPPLEIPDVHTVPKDYPPKIEDFLCRILSWFPRPLYPLISVIYIAYSLFVPPLYSKF
nr:reverse transcriptase domain-containing protein [Tanacetum cinerariifolium]